MVVPKQHDKLMKRLMESDKHKEKKVYSSSELSEFNALEWDIKRGIKLPEHKMQRYLELKKILRK